MPREFYVATDQSGEQLMFEDVRELAEWLSIKAGRTVIRIEKL